MAQQKTRMAVLFADVSESTHLYESLGDTAAFRNVRDVIDMLKRTTEAFGGRVVKTIGDGLMSAFLDADACAKAAAEMQRRIAQRPPTPQGKQLTIRVGFHYGPVIQDGDDVFGDSVNVAARMSGLALSGQAILTAETVAALSADVRESIRPINALPVKGKAAEIDVYELMWQVSSDRTLIPGHVGPISVPTGGPRIRIRHQGEERIFRDVVYFGREAAGNHVVVSDPMASRRHAKIDLRAGKFVLVDQSSNGTYIVVGGAEEIRLKREEMILYGSGRFAFGHSTTETDAEVIEFACDSK